MTNFSDFKALSTGDLRFHYFLNPFHAVSSFHFEMTDNNDSKKKSTDTATHTFHMKENNFNLLHATIMYNHRN